MKSSILLLLTICTSVVLAQVETNDSVSLSPGYTSMSFYSLANGEQGNISAMDWDIQFVTNPMSAGIRVNDAAGGELFELPNSAVANWMATDTTGMIVQYNTDTSWDVGALNIGTNNFDNYGWGTYDFVSHDITGAKFFILKTVAGDFKKFMIDALDYDGIAQSQSYQFRYADMDNSNEVLDTFVVTDFISAHSVYYSITAGQLLDDEPNKNDWDIVFRKYVTPLGGGIYYPVTGVLSNSGVYTAEARNVSIDITSDQGFTYVNQIGNIGSDWKNFDRNTNMWELEDSLIYFVLAKDSNIYKIVFTDFGGAATGNIYFTKTKLSAVTGIEKYDVIQNFVTYPNPAYNELNVLFSLEESEDLNLIITDLAGKTVKEELLNSRQGLNNVSINLSDYANGYYLINLSNEQFSSTSRFVVSQ